MLPPPQWFFPPGSGPWKYVAHTAAPWALEIPVGGVIVSAPLTLHHSATDPWRAKQTPAIYLWVMGTPPKCSFYVGATTRPLMRRVYEHIEQVHLLNLNRRQGQHMRTHPDPAIPSGSPAGGWSFQRIAHDLERCLHAGGQVQLHARPMRAAEAGAPSDESATRQRATRQHATGTVVPDRSRKMDTERERHLAALGTKTYLDPVWHP